MKNWQKSRNYRRIKDENGNVIANIITVDGSDVEVTEEVFLAYSKADRRERYIAEELESGKVLSLDQLEEDHVLSSYIGKRTSPGAEEYCIAKEDSNARERLLQTLLLAITHLNDSDQELIAALFFDGISTRDYARRCGVTQRAIIKRRDRILRDLKKIL